MILPRPLVTAAWLREHRDEVIVADVRWYLDGRSGRAAHERGHIPGSVFVDLDNDLSAPAGPSGRHPLPSPADFAAAMGRQGITNSSAVVAYDDAGGMVAGRLWWMLDALGVAVAVLDGGLEAWGDDLEPGAVAVEPTTFEPSAWPANRFASGDDVASRGADVVLLDARSAERFAGEPNAIDPRFGHIPGARHAAFGANVDAAGRFRPAAELAERFTGLGLDPETEVIAYCGSGVSACSNLLAMHRVGLTNTRLYVGSWSEWGADEERPVETGS